MPKWNDYLAHARARGSLACEVYCVVSTPGDDADLRQRTLPEHLSYLGTLEERGALAFAGPLSDETGDEMLGAGMLILRADNMDEARALADGDPMHTTGARTYTLRKWMINEGSLSISVQLSKQTAKLA